MSSAAATSGTQAPPVAPKLAASCSNCGERRPHSVAETAESYRCFHCGAVNVAGQALTARGAAVEVATESLGAPRQITLRQREDFDGVSWPHIAYLCAFVPLALAGAGAAKSVGWLWPVNERAEIIALGFSPLVLLLLCTLAGLIATRATQRRFEALFAAIPPREAGARLRCHGCGDALRPSTQKVVRCGRCGSDSIASLALARRVGRTEASITPEGSTLFANEAAFAHDALTTARVRSKIATLLLPALALAAYGGMAWKQNWNMPYTSKRSFAVITMPTCNTIVPPAGPVSDGWARTDMPLRGSLSIDRRLPAVYNELLTPSTLVGKRVLAGAGSSATIDAVYRRVRSDAPRMRIRTASAKRELDVIGACVEEPQPYRYADGVLHAEREAAAAKRRADEDTRRRLLQGQLHLDAEPTPTTNGASP